jgi:uncharacterized membrane-anchored protein
LVTTLKRKERKEEKIVNNDWLKRIIIFSIPLMILTGMTISPLMTLTMGKEIQLETNPIDPTDLFRGDYVTLSYKVESVPFTKVDKEILSHFIQANKSGKESSLTVYTLLKKNANGIYQVERVVKNKPKTGIYLEGKIHYLWVSSEEDLKEEDQMVDIDYNLDKFFVPENTGIELEEATRKGKAIATVKVRDGKAILTHVDVKE